MRCGSVAVVSTLHTDTALCGKVQVEAGGGEVPTTTYYQHCYYNILLQEHCVHGGTRTFTNGVRLGTQQGPQEGPQAGPQG